MRVARQIFCRRIYFSFYFCASACAYCTLFTNLPAVFSTAAILTNGKNSVKLITPSEPWHSAKHKKGERIAMKEAKYSKELPRRLYSYFAGYENQPGAPSFSKFARNSGFTLEELQSFRVHKEFERAWRECNEIRRDYLIDTALTRRYDPSFVKFLLTEDGAQESGAEEINVTVTVTDV